MLRKELILLFAIAIQISVARNLTIKIGYINSAAVTGKLEAKAAFAFAEQHIRQLQLISENVQFQ